MWIKLSGASKDLINRTGIFKQKESIKYSRYGRLILVPPRSEEHTSELQ